MPRILRGLHFDPPYDGIFKGLLSFKSFADAEATIGKLDALRKRFLIENDNAGLECTRAMALLGRMRAEAVGRNTKVSAGNRQRKIELAQWFQVWLETPDLFPTWLAMRKETLEFKRLSSEEPGMRISAAGPPE
jgi:hypothetical protein